MKIPRTPTAVAASIVGAALMILFGSPPLLWLVQHVYPFNWQLLGVVGASYTGIGTLLSLLAFSGVVYSVVLQTRQLRGQQHQTSREMQFRLMEMALADRELGSLYSAPGTHSPATQKKFRREVYIVFQFRYMQYSYIVGLFDDNGLRAVLRDEIFEQPEFRKRWLEVEDVWLHAYTNGPERRFCEIAGEECRALESH